MKAQYLAATAALVIAALAVKEGLEAWEGADD